MKIVNFLDLTSESFIFLHKNHNPVNIKQEFIDLLDFSYLNHIITQLGKEVKFNYHIGLMRDSLKGTNTPCFAATTTLQDSNKVMPLNYDSKLFQLTQVPKLLEYIAFPSKVFEECERDILIYSGRRKNDKELIQLMETWKENCK